MMYMVIDENGIVYTGEKSEMKKAFDTLSLSRADLIRKYGTEEADDLIEEWGNVEHGKVRLMREDGVEE